MNSTDVKQQSQHPLVNYQFSSDELRVLRECNSESFFQRSLPLGTGLGVAAYFAVRNGVLKPNARYGAVPKVVVGVVFGYFLGKFSYQQKCAEKLMMLPNSRLGEVLRQRQKGGVFDRFSSEQNLGMGLALAPFNPPSEDIYSDGHLSPRANSSLNLDAEMRPVLSGLDDIYRPSMDSPTTVNELEIPVQPLSPGTSYEELRKKNREEYAKQLQTPFPRTLPESAKDEDRRNGKNLSENSKKIKSNKYGDTWTEE